MPVDIFGNLFDADQLESAVRDKLKLWFDTYLRELEYQRGLPNESLARPRSFLVTEELDREMGDQIPAIVVVSPGLVEPPAMEGTSYYRARWHVAVGCMVEAGGADARANTTKLLRRYTAVARAIMLQHRNYFDFDEGDEQPEITDVVWVDESYDRLDFEAGVSIAAGEAVFEVEVTHVVKRHGGPAHPATPDPDEQVGADWPTADTTEVTVTPVPITEEV